MLHALHKFADIGTYHAVVCYASSAAGMSMVGHGIRLGLLCHSGSSVLPQLLRFDLGVPLCSTPGRTAKLNVEQDSRALLCHALCGWALL